jgi:hypothetical protein
LFAAIGDGQGLLVEEVGIDQGLDPVLAGCGKGYVDKEADVVGKSARRNLKTCRLGHNHRRRAIGSTKAVILKSTGCGGRQGKAYFALFTATFLAKLAEGLGYKGDRSRRQTAGAGGRRQEQEVDGGSGRQGRERR